MWPDLIFCLFRVVWLGTSLYVAHTAGFQYWLQMGLFMYS